MRERERERERERGREFFSLSRVEFNGDWVTAAPDIYQTNLKDCEFIILASDGLWDYIQT